MSRCGKGFRGNLLCNVGNGIENATVADPHVTWCDPCSRHFITEDLVWAPHLGHNVCNWGTMAVPHKMERHDVQVLVQHSLPGIGVSPPLKLVALVIVTTTAGNVDTSVVAELELDAVGGDEARPRLGAAVGLDVVGRVVRARPERGAVSG